ncbi:MAG: hypothetical protein COB81_03135 [Flavobacteriaceae bacterium]|nr:MAG: hypothetical protein COB81_03135 [Flavobacteriaceae bacterium]
MYSDSVKEGKTIAIISYITWIGTLIAYFMNSSKKNSFAAFHIRQSVGLALCSFLITAIQMGPDMGMIGKILKFALLVLWVIGLLGCIKGEKKKIPLFGDVFQDWFKRI